MQLLRTPLFGIIKKKSLFAAFMGTEKYYFHWDCLDHLIVLAVYKKLEMKSPTYSETTR